MCLFRIRDYKDCQHKYVSPLFCPQSTQDQRFCNSVKTLTTSNTRCKHCQAVYTLSRTKNNANNGGHQATSMSEEDIKQLNKACESVQRHRAKEDGVAVECLNERSDRGLGAPLVFNAKYMMPPTKKDKNLEARVSDEKPKCIGNDGGLEWKDHKQTHCETLQIPQGRYFVDLSPQQLEAWWRDRKSLTIDKETWNTLNAFWGREDILKYGSSTPVPERLRGTLRWVFGDTPSTDPHVVESEDFETIRQEELERRIEAWVLSPGTAPTQQAEQQWSQEVNSHTTESLAGRSSGITVTREGTVVRHVPISDHDVIRWVDHV